MAQFAATAIDGNNVSLSRGLSTFGINNSPLPTILSAVTLLALTVMFLPGKYNDVLDALPRRSLVLLAAIGWVSHDWLNYYSASAKAFIFAKTALFFLPKVNPTRTKTAHTVSPYFIVLILVSV